MLLIGKPSISMGHLYHGYVSHNQRVYVIIIYDPWDDPVQVGSTNRWNITHGGIPFRS